MLISVSAKSNLTETQECYIFLTGTGSVVALACTNFINHTVDECFEFHCADVAVLIGIDSDISAFDLFVTDDKHIRDLLELVFTDLVTDFFVAVVDLGSDVKCVQLFEKRFAVFACAVGYREDFDLYRRQPCRERACEMLCDDADEAFYRAEYNAVDHNGTVLFAVGAGIFELKSFRKLEVELDGAALPGSSEAVLDVEVKLRTVERAVAFVYDDKPCPFR